MENELRTQLIDELASFGIPCSEEAADLMVRHLLLVIEKNKQVNLTRITDVHDGVTLHIVDSLLPLACPELQGSETPSKALKFIDIGTGAGYPGIPLGAITGAQGTLIDSVGKKVTAVQSFKDSLGLNNLVPLHTRVEDLGQKYLGAQDWVFARAVAQSNVLVEYAAPLLKFGGLLILEKARPETAEVVAAESAAKLCGMKLLSQRSFELPRGLGHREILIFAKVAKPRIKLPRKAGMAKHQPLGL